METRNKGYNSREFNMALSEEEKNSMLLKDVIK